MKLDKHVVDMFTELTKPADDVKMEKTCYGTISVVDGTRYVKLDGSDLLVPAASTVKTSHGDRVTVLMKNHSLTVTGNLTAPATDGEGGSSGEAGTAATIEVGTVTTGEAGSSATVTNSGTTSAAVFDFVIPRGDKGEKGDIGPQGPQGEKGDTGTWDGTIPDHEHTTSDITDFPTSLPANGGSAKISEYIGTWGAPEQYYGEALKMRALYNKFGDYRFGLTTDTDNEIRVDYATNATTVDGLSSNVIPHGYQMTYHDANLCIKSGYYMLSQGDSNIPVDTYGILTVNNGDWFDSDAAWASQIFMPANGGPAYRRMYANKSFTSWVNLADGGNADTLDGKHASDFADNIYKGYPEVGNCNNATAQGVYTVSHDSANAPDTNYYTLIVDVAGDGTWIFQTAILASTESVAYRRTRINGNWGAWRNIADGGDANTLDGLHANEIASNPNLLINSWFGNGVINQRGQTIYPAVSGASNTIDCWKTIDNFDLTVNDGFITLSNGDSLWHKYFNQSIEGLKRFAGQAVTISAKVRYSNGDYYLVSGKHIDYPGSDWQIVSHTIIMPDTDELTYIYGGYGVAGSIDIMWIKLELGSVATSFIPPNPATELAKCQRYYQIRSTGNIPAVDLRPSMRTTPTVAQLSDGNYAYSAEL